MPPGPEYHKADVELHIDVYEKGYGYQWEGDRYDGPRYSDLEGEQRWLRKFYWKKGSYHRQGEERSTSMSPPTPILPPPREAGTGHKHSDLIGDAPPITPMDPKGTHVFPPPDNATLSSNTLQLPGMGGATSSSNSGGGDPPTFVPLFDDMDAGFQPNPSNEKVSSASIFVSFPKLGFMNTQETLSTSPKEDAKLREIRAEVKEDKAADDAWFENCHDSSIEFITKQYIKCNDTPETKMIYVHVTNATSRGNIEEVMTSVTQVIVKSVLRRWGMM